jgi:hypothetical protein
LASRRRRRKSIGKVVVDVERRIRRVEKRPGSKRLKTNVVTTEKLGFRAVTTKTVAPDAITANEADFGTTVVTDTEPTAYLKEGLTWVNPDDGSTNVYSTDLGDFVTVTDAAAVAIAQGKNKTYVQDNQPTGGSYSEGDLWIDTNDGNKLYAYVGTAWVLKQDGDIASALASANGKNTIYRQTSQPSGGTYVTGDTWFDSDDNNKIYRYNGTTWVAVQLGGNGLANINANAITTGTIDASVITVSNLDAGNITTGTINVGGSIKISTSPLASGNTARVEINSTGFYAYNGTVATVSITNTGTAVFSGTVNASAGAFTGYITAGTARFGAGVQTGKNGIYINANNYWYDDATFKVGDSSESMSWTSAGGLVVSGEINANSGTFSGTITATGTISGGTISGATITGSSFTSTNYPSGTGLALAPTGTGNTILFNVSGSQIGSIAAVAGGILISSGSSSLTMSSAGAVVLDGAFNSITLASAPYLESSGSNTGGSYGSLRNTFASSSAPASLDGGDGDVWLRWS